MSISSLQPFSASGGYWHRPQAAPGLQATRGTVQQSIGASVTIVTAEGDKVTLSASSERQLEFATYNARGFIRGNRSTQSQAVRNSLSVSVEGDLSREELHDIRKAIKTIGHVANELAEGDVDGAARQAEKLQRLDSLAGIEAEVEVKQEVTVEKLFRADCPCEPETPMSPMPDDKKQPVVPPICKAPDDNSTSTADLLQKLIGGSSDESAAKSETVA